MKIYYLSNSPIPSKMANSVQVMKMCKSLKALGNNVELFARETKDNIDDIYSYYGVNEKFRINLVTWPKIRFIGGKVYANLVYKKILERGLPDLFYGRDLYSLLRVSKLGIPIVLELHTVPTNFYTRNIIKKLTKSKNFKNMVVTADSLKLEFEKLCPWLGKQRITVVRNGADIPEPLNEKVTLKSDKSRYSVGYVGHLYPGKGMELIQKIAEQLQTHDFHIVGGTPEDINYWKGIIKTKNVVFHGFVPNGKLNEYYAMFDVVLAPYQSLLLNVSNNRQIDKWASPLKLIEYMSYKKAVIASDLPMVKEVIKDGENGMLCSVNDIDCWTNKIMELSQNELLRSKISEKGYLEFTMKYTWEKRAKTIINISNPR